MINTHIIIVNYNAGDWLRKSVASALQFSQGLVTVVDNHSNDKSVSDAQSQVSNDRLAWQLNDQNLGFAAANNQVLRLVDTKYAVLMNPDCELNKDTLALIVMEMELDPLIGLASCRILNEDGSLQTTCRRRFPTPWSAFGRMSKLNRVFPKIKKIADFDYGSDIDITSPIEQVEAVSGAFMVVRTDAIEQIGLLDEGYFMHCEDLDWCKRFELGGWKVTFVPSASVVHAKGVSTQSRPIGVLYTLHTGMNRFFDKFYATQTPLLLRVVVKFGIAFSFLVRSLRSLVTGVFKL